MKYTNNFYNKNLKQNAIKLRGSSTKAESCLWKFALSKNKTGVQFLRQRVVDKYIVDFICLPLKLIIEVDGETHNIESIANQDILRQNDLENIGYTFLRFTDDEVLKNMDGVILVIQDEVKSLTNQASNTN